ncbi:MAG: putative AlkP superfamily phosphohydrolase/phosphomutase [Myxococcota bacterium]|jgi:predicted AlkP superfamily phosphohydrolase/phosphomutase
MKTTSIICIAACVLFGACSDGGLQSEKRVVVFGVDGLDPEMLQERIDRGLMPNFAKAIASGSNFQSLQTSWPPQSPVAWSNFISGVNPGKHGLYDFIHVNRDDYSIQSSMVETDEVGMEMTLFGYDVPLSGGASRSTRKFPAFWEVMSEDGVPVYVHRMPAAYPLTESKAVVFPDMGTPDLVGALSGVAYLFTENESQSARVSDSYRVERIKMKKRSEGKFWRSSSRIYGPADTMINVDDLLDEQHAAEDAGDFAEANKVAKKIEREQEVFTAINLMVDNTNETPVLAVDIDGQYATAELGDWSNWVPIEFSMLGGLIPVAGYTRFRFISAEPFEAYAVPVQFDPWSPVSPISSPEEASGELADAIGPYFVQGFADAYKAYKGHVLDTAGFINESDMVLEERTAMMHYGLDQIDETGGLLFLYTGSLDMRCHMLWHTSDDAHPHQEDDGEYAGVAFDKQIDRVYSQVDTMFGELMARVDELEKKHGNEIEVLVMSDHGFAPFHRKMHINDWLVQEGYLVMAEGKTKTGAHGLAGDEIDWSQSKAYAVGFNGIIINRQGRESQGIVSDSEADSLMNEISSKLLAMTDPESGTNVFTSVKRATEVFSGDEVVNAPDLQLGFNVGFGASDECATGAVTGEGVIVDNDSRWSGSHLMDPELVRGTIVSVNGRDLIDNPALEDVTATLYELFTVTAPDNLDGVSLFKTLIEK